MCNIPGLLEISHLSAGQVTRLDAR